jgi:hypothetical protein
LLILFYSGTHGLILLLEREDAALVITEFSARLVDHVILTVAVMDNILRLFVEKGSRHIFEAYTKMTASLLHKAVNIGRVMVLGQSVLFDRAFDDPKRKTFYR